ncbi:MAG TPA: hypothetical protein VKH19_15785, partial [Gemmatimonadaceae bacterium]|nr:hypothetical protein [Gemmatimonadaceae bacterium]
MRLARRLTLGLLPLVTVCADPAPTTGSLIVQIDGLPAGSMGQVTVYGPKSFKQVLASTMTLQNLVPGSYVISPGTVSFANALYRSGPSLTKKVTAGNTESATVSYALGSAILNLSVTGLPADVAPQIVLSGPVARVIYAAGVIDQLPAGTYTLTTDTLTPASGDLWAAPQRQRTLELAPSFTPVDLEVHYDVASGSLSLSVAGLPDSTGAPVTITGPNGFRRTVGASVEYKGLTPGPYAVAAAPMNICPDRYTASTTDQSVAVSLGQTGSASVAYARKAAAPEDLNLSIDAMYLVQAVQDINGSVPLVAGRPALLRVFGRANQCNSATPTVRATLSSGETYTLSLSPGEASVATDIDEGALTRSWNTLIPGDKVQPGLSIVAEIDPDGAIAETNESDNRFPAAGARSPQISVMPIVGLRFVPVVIGGVAGRVSLSRVDSLLSVSLKLHPVSGYDVEVRAAYSSTHASLTRDDVNGWGAILSELEALRVADSSRRFYHGIVRVTYSSGIAGLAYVGGRAGMSWDYLPTGAEIIAHELAHNFGRTHSPCGGPGGVDPAYPFADGRTGSFGYDVTDGSLKLPTATDIMGYCNNKWISAYTFS